VNSAAVDDRAELRTAGLDGQLEEWTSVDLRAAD